MLRLASITADAKTGEYKLKDASEARDLYTAYEVSVTGKDGKSVTVNLDEDGEKSAQKYVAKGQTVYFTLPVGTYTVKVGETSKVLEVTDAKAVQSESVTGDIKVTYYETKEAFEANVAKAMENINLDGEEEPADGITMSFNEATNTLSVAIDMAKFEGGLVGGTQNTGTMDALEALYEAGYTVTLKRDGKQAITLTKGTDAEYKATILSYISDLVGMKGATNKDTITVTINGLNGNSMTGYVELSITVPAN